MNKRKWGAIAIIIGLLLIAGIIYLLFFYKPLISGPAVEQPLAQEPGAGLPKQAEPPKQPATVQPVSPLKRAEIKQADLARMASAFAERFGSFSNQSDYGNIRDLQIFMTDKMKSWSENYISEARASRGDTSIYYGIVTKSILSQAKQFDSDIGQAEILVKTQRRESTGPLRPSSSEARVSGNSAAFYQDIIINYLKEGSVWRVDAVYWQAK